MPFFDLAWLIPLLPLLAFALISLVPAIGRSRQASYTTALVLLGISTIIAWGALFQGVSEFSHSSGEGHSAVSSFIASSTPSSAETPVLAAEAEAESYADFGDVYQRSFVWAPDGVSAFRMGYRLDGATLLMLAMVTLAAWCIHLFSVGYMAHDEYPAGTQRQSRFFSYIALFTASMLGMTLADNLLLFFICWELMGLCSFLLIGFFYFKPSAREAAKKAFITTRIGDVGMMLGMMYIYNATGSLTFGTEPGQMYNAQFLDGIKAATSLIPGVTVATVMAFLIFMGTIGKSAQFPLHVWLPDAMEGPTPVSALIHAATMVAAGVFLVVRTFPIFQASDLLPFVAFIGAFTALFAALIAVAQYDIKRILAFSTLSQLGFMVASLGIGAWVAALFHLLTHAFFKALLFLGSGSVIHGMEATVGHNPDQAQDIRNMGAMRKFMPLTFLTYIAGYLALVGVAPFAGFWSKDEILLDAYHHEHLIVYGVLSFAAFLTAFYMTRQIMVVFFGKFRGYEPRAVSHANHSEAVAVNPHDAHSNAPDAHGHVDHGHDAHDDHHHAHTAHDPHESPRSMTIPLMILALFAVGAGFANAPLIGIHWLADFVSAIKLPEIPTDTKYFVAGVATVIGLVGMFLGYLVYRNAFRTANERDPLAKWLGPIWTLLENKFYVDEIYDKTIIAWTYGMGWVMNWIDRHIVDRVVNLTGLATLFLGRMNFIIDDFSLNTVTDDIGEGTIMVGDGVRQSATGKIQDYGAYIFGGVVLVALIYMYAF
ncbi:MAG: NADH-quinone oxidoreductase subunit L [Herpetosiphon sp.]|nr:NADH-quinone oxidoreductase subunit L [Herpetosiphon sp.]